MGYQSKFKQLIAIKKSITSDAWEKYIFQRKTIDNPKFDLYKDDEYHWEILWEWFNWEVSMAYPYPVLNSKMMLGVKYFKTKKECQKICDLLNRRLSTKTKKDGE